MTSPTTTTTNHHQQWKKSSLLLSTLRIQALLMNNLVEYCFLPLQVIDVKRTWRFFFNSLIYFGENLHYEKISLQKQVISEGEKKLNRRQADFIAVYEQVRQAIPLLNKITQCVRLSSPSIRLMLDYGPKRWKKNLLFLLLCATEVELDKAPKFKAKPYEQKGRRYDMV
ncbi:uncharacterized protein LOC111832014 [Capsella rubella]|uniref:uncharacterized protein LOC111832014 n=1 Tax=Capsella rubella TaxID=81985 RepID=UPI000CD50562|nr:uncharacterized protein LOC111832014 [Capsella rubella]XP_023643852.1 uncharacterized protein LOC111832014 [Capsella rubella]XP_023643853.1 uncharacterized protein LOC111832014 [Capsella rubella]